MAQVAYVLKWLETIPEERSECKALIVGDVCIDTVACRSTYGCRTETTSCRSRAARARESDDATTDLIGRIAAIRATLAVIQNDAETIIAQSLRAQETLDHENSIFRTIATWTLGFAYQLKGDRTAASRAYAETIAIDGDSLYTTAATITLGQIQESDNQLSAATRTYDNGLNLAGDPPHMIACEAYLGLARIAYERNDLNAAQQYGDQCLQLTKQMETVDSFASHGVFLARLMLARGDAPGAVAVLAEAEAFVHRYHFEFRMPKVAAAQVLALLHQGDLKAAASLAQKHDLTLDQARVFLAQGDPSAALAVLEPLRQQMDAKGWGDERLKVMTLQAVAHHAFGEKDTALQHLAEALALAEPENFVRTFVDEGAPMEHLLSEAAVRGIMPDYVGTLLAVFEVEKKESDSLPIQTLIDPLSARELEILTLIAAGLKNKEIADQLFISLNTVLYHIKNIYGKLGVNKRTLAIIAARELNLLPGD